MIRTSQDQVRHFMQSKCYMPDPPDRPVQVDAQLGEQRHDFLAEENKEYLDAVLAGDLTAVADAIADCLYIVLGTAVAHGIDLQPIFDAVHRSNMTKAGVDLITGKGGKDPGYVPPTTEIAALLLQQLTGLEEPRLGEFRNLIDELVEGGSEVIVSNVLEFKKRCADCGCAQHEGVCGVCGHRYSMDESAL